MIATAERNTPHNPATEMGWRAREARINRASNTAPVNFEEAGVLRKVEQQVQAYVLTYTGDWLNDEVQVLGVRSTDYSKERIPNTLKVTDVLYAIQTVVRNSGGTCELNWNKGVVSDEKALFHDQAVISCSMVPDQNKVAAELAKNDNFRWSADASGQNKQKDLQGYVRLANSVLDQGRLGMPMEPVEAGQGLPGVVAEPVPIGNEMTAGGKTVAFNFKMEGKKVRLSGENLISLKNLRQKGNKYRLTVNIEGGKAMVVCDRTCNDSDLIAFAKDAGFDYQPQVNIEYQPTPIPDGATPESGNELPGGAATRQTTNEQDYNFRLIGAVLELIVGGIGATALYKYLNRGKAESGGEGEGQEVETVVQTPQVEGRPDKQISTAQTHRAEYQRSENRARDEAREKELEKHRLDLERAALGGSVDDLVAVDRRNPLRTRRREKSQPTPGTKYFEGQLNDYSSDGLIFEPPDPDNYDFREATLYF